MTRPKETDMIETKDRGAAGAIMDGLWPLLGGDMTPSDVWHDINEVVTTALATAQTEAAELRAEVERLRGALRSTHWTVANQTVAKALCEAVAVCALGPSDDEGNLTLYDIIPDVWCVPDRFAATNDIAEQIAFTALEAWLTAARATLAQGTQPHE